MIRGGFGVLTACGSSSGGVLGSWRLRLRRLDQGGCLPDVCSLGTDSSCLGANLGSLGDVLGILGAKLGSLGLGAV